MSRRITALFLALAVSGAAFSDDADPPSRAGRLSYLQGEVVMQPESGAPEDAELNRPLTLGDRLMTSSGSRAELSLGTAAVRLDESTDLLIANLDDDIAQIELNSGTLGIHVRELREAEIMEIDTPHAAVTLRRPGDYRIGVDPQGGTVLAVRTGEAELDGGQGPIRLSDRQVLRFTGVEQLADVSALGPLNAFDEWCIERERAIADAESTRYVSRDVVGYEDLDRYGRWRSEPGYGYVWAPRVVIVGWAPYRFGHWTWIWPWGWTWIDHAPWGFAPFHFGRWAFLHHRWCWVPGPRHHRPVFAPALVAWKGTPHEGGPVHGAVSWFPLGTRDVHVPLHPASPRYLRNVNISNTVIDNNALITNVARNRMRNIRFANRDAPDAVTTLPGSVFDAHRAAPGRFLRVNPQEPPRPIKRESVPRAASTHDARWRATFRGRSGEPDERLPAFRQRDDQRLDSDRMAVPTQRESERLNGERRTTLPALRQQDGEGQNSDGRMTLPRVPTERRVMQGNSNSNGTPRLSMERRVIESDGSGTREHNDVVHFARRFDRPPTALRTEPPRTMGAEREQRMQSPRTLSQPSRNADQHTSRSSRSDGGSRGRSSVEARSSGQSQHAGSSGRSRSSMSRGQSGRSGFSANRR